MMMNVEYALCCWHRRRRHRTSGRRARGTSPKGGHQQQGAHHAVALSLSAIKSSKQARTRNTAEKTHERNKKKNQ